MDMGSEFGVFDGDFSLFLEELTAEPLDASRAAGCAGSAFTGGSFACAGSCGSSAGTASSFSSGTG